MAKNTFNPVGAPWLSGIFPVDVRDKVAMVSQHIRYMLNRTTQAFKWSGLPDTIPQYVLEQMLQGNGSCIITDTPEGLRAFTGGLGGNPDCYYRATRYFVSNPTLSLSKEYKIDEDCVLCRNDHSLIGLMPLNRRYATLLTENEISMYMAMINSRLQFHIKGGTDSDKIAGDDLIRSLEQGKLKATASSAFLDGLQVQPATESSDRIIGALIENEQYIKASWFNELGIDSNYNMKRESLTTTESQMGTYALYPLIDDMLECRKEACDKLNAMYSTTITVELNSSWKEAQELSEPPEETEVNDEPSD